MHNYVFLVQHSRANPPPFRSPLQPSCKLKLVLDEAAEAFAYTIYFVGLNMALWSILFK